MVLSHHERWDGSGYPEGLHTEQIPLGARILAVADSFSAMVDDRPYRKGMEPAKAMAEIIGASGRLYDPQVVTAFQDIAGTPRKEGFMANTSLFNGPQNRLQKDLQATEMA
ncbi:MAG: hypothetical protein C0613_07765 [Desulfobulbaceae bacterium]|nr:MAG: hypothetical protein C0613_07765 [Desulfobulbaceae bacterium]